MKFCKGCRKTAYRQGMAKHKVALLKDTEQMRQACLSCTRPRCGGECEKLARIARGGSMIEWKDCMQVDKREYVWVAYSKDYPFLPVAIASSAAELAKIVGVSTNAVESLWSKYVHRKVSRARYARVLIEE